MSEIALLHDYHPLKADPSRKCRVLGECVDGYLLSLGGKPIWVPRSYTDRPQGLTKRQTHAIVDKRGGNKDRDKKKRRLKP